MDLEHSQQPLTPNIKPINYGEQFLLFITFIFGIIWQGGSLFWFGPAASSIALILTYFVLKNYNKTLLKPTGIIPFIILAFVLWMFVTVLWSPVTSVSFIKALTIFALPSGFYLYFLVCSTNENWNKLWQIVIWVGLLLFAYTVIEVLLGVEAPNSLFFNHNTHASYLNLIILPTAAYFLLSSTTRNATMLGGALLLIIFSQALPGSRGAGLGQFIAFFLLFFIAWKHINKKKIKQFFILYISALFIATLVTGKLFRFFAFTIKEADNYRYEIWESSINLLATTPWYGNGAGTFWLMYPHFRNIVDISAGQNAHNDYLQYLIEGGMPALILLLSLIASIILLWINTVKNKHISTNHKIESTAIFGGLLAIGFHSFFSFNLSLFCILFLSGLLIARLIFLAQQTSSTNIFLTSSLRPFIYKFAISLITIFCVAYFSSISLFSYFYSKSVIEFNQNNIKGADLYNNLAISFNPYDDRPYVLYAQFYRNLLNLDNQPKVSKKEYYLSTAMQYLDLAEKLNPYRAKIYYLRAKLVEENHQLLNGNRYRKIVENYNKAIDIKPRFIQASIGLSNFLVLNNKIEQGLAVMFHNVEHHHNAFNPETRVLYSAAKMLLIKYPRPKYQTLLNKKLKNIQAAYQVKGLKMPKNY